MRCLALLALLMPFSAHGVTPDAADDSSANLVNLDYYLRTGLLRTDLSFSSQLNEASGLNSVSFVRGTLFLEYGLLTDGLRIAVSESDAVTAYNGQGSSYFFSGVSEPKLQMNYRFWESLPGGWSIDGQLDLTPAFGTYTYGSSQFPGTQLAPATSLSATAAAFWRQGINEMRFVGTLTHRFSGNYVSQLFPGEVTTAASCWIESLGITDRVHVSPKFYVQAEGIFQFENTIDFAYTDGSTSYSSVPFHVDPTISAGYLASPQILLAMHLSYAGYTSTSNASSNTFRETSWGATAMIEF